MDRNLLLCGCSRVMSPVSFSKLLRLLGLQVAGVAAVLLSMVGSAAEPGSAKVQTPPGTFLNPLGDPPIHLQEPFILTHARQYFLFGTVSPAEGFQCYESTDLAHWKLDGWAWRRMGLHVAQGELHSPRAFLYQNTFCLVYSALMPGGIQLGLAASLKPEGPYHDLHVPWLPLGEGCVAGEVFIDNGKPYLIYTRSSPRNDCNYRSIWGVALAKDLSKILGTPAPLLEPSQRWELAQRNLNRINQASGVFKSGSKYFLTYFANDARTAECAIGYASANRPLGPWSKATDNLLVRTYAERGVYGPAHGAVFRSLDRSEWFMVYDTLNDPTNHPEDRVVNIDRLVQHTTSLSLNGPTRSPQPLP